MPDRDPSEIIRDEISRRIEGEFIIGPRGNRCSIHGYITRGNPCPECTREEVSARGRDFNEARAAERERNRADERHGWSPEAAEAHRVAREHSGLDPHADSPLGRLRTLADAERLAHSPYQPTQAENLVYLDTFAATLQRLTHNRPSATPAGYDRNGMPLCAQCGRTATGTYAGEPRCRTHGTSQPTISRRRRSGYTFGRYARGPARCLNCGHRVRLEDGERGNHNADCPAVRGESWRYVLPEEDCGWDRHANDPTDARHEWVTNPMGGSRTCTRCNLSVSDELWNDMHRNQPLGVDPAVEISTVTYQVDTDAFQRSLRAMQESIENVADFSPVVIDSLTELQDSIIAEVSPAEPVAPTETPVADEGEAEPEEESPADLTARCPHGTRLAVRCMECVSEAEAQNPGLPDDPDAALLAMLQRASG